MTLDEIREGVEKALSIPDDKLTPEQHKTMTLCLEEVRRLEADKVTVLGQPILERLQEYYIYVLHTNGVRNGSGNAHTAMGIELDSTPMSFSNGASQQNICNDVVLAASLFISMNQ